MEKLARLVVCGCGFESDEVDFRMSGQRASSFLSKTYCLGFLLSVLCFIVGLNVGLHGWVHMGADSVTPMDPVRSFSTTLPTEEGIKATVPTIPLPIATERATVPPKQTNRVATPPARVITRETVKPKERQPIIPITAPPTTSPPKSSLQSSIPIKRESVKDLIFSVKHSESVNGARESATTQIDHQEVAGIFTNYIQKEKKLLPIAILTCNRAELLQKTIQNLLAVRGVEKSNVVVIQDGTDASVSSVVRGAGLTLHQNTLGLNLRGGVPSDGGSRIATHYKYALSTALDVYYPNAPAVIVVEDDLLFAPDFYEYFHAVAPILDHDRSVFVISAWNDNGFKGRVSDKLALKRTEYFPGLGWLLPRQLYKEELERRWPTNHWDHWLRSPENYKGRDILYPEVSALLRCLYKP